MWRRGSTRGGSLLASGATVLIHCRNGSTIASQATCSPVNLFVPLSLSSSFLSNSRRASRNSLCAANHSSGDPWRGSTSRSRCMGSSSSVGSQWGRTYASPTAPQFSALRRQSTRGGTTSRSRHSFRTRSSPSNTARSRAPLRRSSRSRTASASPSSAGIGMSSRSFASDSCPSCSNTATPPPSGCSHSGSHALRLSSAPSGSAFSRAGRVLASCVGPRRDRRPADGHRTGGVAYGRAMRRLRRHLAVLAAGALLVTACSSASDTVAPTTTLATTTTAAASSTTTTTHPTVPADFDVRVSTHQVTVTGADPGTEIRVVAPDGPVTGGTVDEQGNLVLREIPSGDGYLVEEVVDDGPVPTAGPFHVPTPDEIPDPSFYASQTLVEGLNYIEMRDGVTLAAMVRLPGPPEDGPYPTVVEYSGYDPANPDEPEPMTGIFTTFGYATVGVNMRGSGCSGGAFDFFSELQTLDGYDLIETIAAQPWVLGHAVGMVGISYPGISQLFVASTRPPSLAAISPLSVIEDSYRSVVYPGGIYNDGFAKSWAESRQGSTEAYGQDWVRTRVDEGDTICEANQALRSQNVDLLERTRDFAYYRPDPGDRLAPRTFVDRIEVPVFLAGAWQDEQTGSRFATMLDDFTNAPVMEVHLYNGAHADSANPVVLARLFEFMDVYVAGRTPTIDPTLRFAAPLLYRQAYGVDGLQLPPDRFTSYEEARAAIENGPPVHLLLEMGGNPDAPGGPLARAEYTFDAWPPPETRADVYRLTADGRLVAPDDPAAGVDGAHEFTVDVARSQIVTPPADDDPNTFDNLAWPPLPDGEALSYETEPFTDDVLLAGSARVSLWIRASADDADLQVTLSEVRPDGQEMYIQSGWLRASHRALDPDESTDLLPFHTHLEEDAAPLPPGEFTRVDVEVFPFAHAVRAGSRLRLVVDNPGGTRNLWTFDVLDADGETVTVGVGPDTPSEIALPVITGELDPPLPAGLPPCPGTRSQPCRPYRPITNRPAG
ncbi:MAG: CocE/NonD family hydrolase [Actinomyces sp.]|nr:MAG: CocE/NonD family hydrolase [Actinomyces sp.]